MIRTSLVILALLLACMPARAMRAHVVGDQLVLEGDVVTTDLALVTAMLGDNPSVTTVILRNSRGGDAPTGYRVGEMFRARRLRTAVSGYCVSSCSRMFLGGSERAFTDDYPAEQTRVGFHGHYDDAGKLNAASVRALGLKDWTLRFAGPGLDPALVERWINIAVSNGAAWFYRPEIAAARGASAFFCNGTEPVHIAFTCERITRSALDLGIITTLQTTASNDQAALRAALPVKPAPTGFAAIDDLAKLPLASEPGRGEFDRFLRAGYPRAFAISPDQRHWAWNAEDPGAQRLALSRCFDRAAQPCHLYAVDDDVVWDSR